MERTETAAATLEGCWRERKKGRPNLATGDACTEYISSLSCDDDPSHTSGAEKTCVVVSEREFGWGLSVQARLNHVGSSVVVESGCC